MALCKQAKILSDRQVRTLWAEVQFHLYPLRLEIFHALAAAGGPPAEVLIDSSAVKAHRCASGGKGGTQSGDRSLTRWADHKNHALTDACFRPIAFLLTDGQVADCIAADELLDGLLTAQILHGDKGYDSNAVR